MKMKVQELNGGSVPRVGSGSRKIETNIGAKNSYKKRPLYYNYTIIMHFIASYTASTHHVM